ncbi:MAG: MFS transporter [Oscillospiraceae bacterium]|nr:MFS transporter [Oscillospiraceae bacterium]
MQTQKKKFYYGWVVTLLAGLTYFGSNGLLSTSAGTIVSQVLLVKGWDPVQVSLTYTIKSVIGLALPLAGILLMRIGPRKCIFWTTTITAVFLALTGWVDSPIMFVLIYGIAVSFSMLFNDQLACFAAVNNWWDRRRGEQGGYVQALGALGGVVFPPIITWLFLNFSWKTSLIIMAMTLMVITAIPQILFMKDHPSDLGLELDGGATEVKPAKGSKSKPAYQGYKSPIDWEIKDAVCTPQLWLVGVAWGSVVFGYCAVQYFGMTHLIMNGFSNMSAASAVSIMSGSILVSSLLLSPLTDRMNPKIALICIGMITSVGCVLFDVSTKASSMPLMVVSMILVGANGPIICAVMNTLVSYYGPKNYAGIQPYCNILLTLIGAASSIVCGWALDNFGSLSNAFYVAAGFGMVMSLIVLLFMKPPKVSEEMLAKYQAKSSV